MGVLTVNRASEDFTSDVIELLSMLGELDDFSWAHESKIQGVEEQHEIFVLVVIQRNSLEGLGFWAVSLSFEGWCSLGDECLDGVSAAHFLKFLYLVKFNYVFVLIFLLENTNL